MNIAQSSSRATAARLYPETTISPASVGAGASQGATETMMTQADASEVLKVRMVTHVTSVHALDVGDTDGHIASVSRFSGLAFYPDGTVGTVSFVSLADYLDGAGTFTLFPILAFPDGSELWVKSVGTGTVDGAVTRFVGAVQVVGGKGRFATVKGDGALTGTRYAPLSIGADLVSDYTINLRYEEGSQCPERSLVGCRHV